MREEGSFFHKVSREPVRLIDGSEMISGTAPSRSGRQVFYAAGLERRELARYDPYSRTFVPFLSGLPARPISFSADGKWISYIAAAEQELWRSKADGSEKLRLTFPPMVPDYYQLAWSPDSRRIAFTAAPGGGVDRVYVVSRDGGSPVALTPGSGIESQPSWSPDGRYLAFERVATAADSTGGQGAIYIVDLKSDKTSLLPGSVGLQGPAWSPDGRFIAATSRVSSRDAPGTLDLFNWRTKQWTELAEGTIFSGPFWSHDSRWVYAQDLLAGEAQPILRVRVADGKIERITPDYPILPADAAGFSLMGLTPNDSVLVDLIRPNTEIYALDLKLP